MTKVNGYNTLSPYELDVLKKLLQELLQRDPGCWQVAEALRILES